jgi:hypothetical protein
MLDLNLLARISYFFLILFLGYNLYFRYILKIKYTKFLILFSINMLIGISLIHLRNSIPDFYSMIFSNLLIGLAEIFLYLAIKGMLGLDDNWKNRYYILILILFIGYMIFTYIYYDLSIKMMISSVYFMSFDAIMGLMFLRDRDKKFRFINIISSIVFFIGSGVFAIKLFNAIFGNINPSYLSNNNIFIYLPYFYLILFCIWMIFLVFIYRKNRNI